MSNRRATVSTLNEVTAYNTIGRDRSQTVPNNQRSTSKSSSNVEILILDEGIGEIPHNQAVVEVEYFQCDKSGKKLLFGSKYRGQIELGSNVHYDESPNIPRELDDVITAIGVESHIRMYFQHRSGKHRIFDLKLHKIIKQKGQRSKSDHITIKHVIKCKQYDEDTCCNYDNYEDEKEETSMTHNFKNSCFYICNYVQYVALILLICIGMISGVICIGYWREILHIPSFIFYIALLLCIMFFVVMFGICCFLRCYKHCSGSTESDGCVGNMINIHWKQQHQNDSKYFKHFCNLLKNKKIDKKKLIKLLDKYQNEIQREYSLSVKVLNDYKDGIKKEYNASIRSFNIFRNSVKKNINNIMNDVLSKYTSQTAIAGYYEIVIVFYALINTVSDDDDCDNKTLLYVQWSLFGFFFVMGIIDQLQTFIHDFNASYISRQVISMIINILVLYVLLMAIELNPFDCYVADTIYLQIGIFVLGLFTTIFDWIIGCKYSEKTIENEEIKEILETMKQKIDKFVEYEQISSSLLFETEMNAIKSSLKQIMTKDEHILNYYFNIIYYYLQEQFGPFLSLSGYYAVSVFIIDIILKYQGFRISHNIEKITRWCLFGLFSMIALIISIKQSWFGKLSVFLRMTYWAKKYIWSFFMCILLMIAVESKPLSFYLDDIFLSCLVIICLLLSIFGHIYFPTLYNWICSKRIMDDDDNMVIRNHHFIIETYQYENVEIEDVENQKQNSSLLFECEMNNNTLKDTEQNRRHSVPIKQKNNHSLETDIGKKRISSVIVTEKVDVNKEKSIKKNLRFELRLSDDLKECSKCGIIRKGKVYQEDGSFYCLQCKK